jgi:hypothetical protein
MTESTTDHEKGDTAMTLAQQAAFVQQHGTEAQAWRAGIYIHTQTSTTRQALACLYRRVCEGRP